MQNYTPSQAFELLYDHYCAQMLSFLKQSNRHFCIVCDMRKAFFEPPLLPESTKYFGNVSQFMISGSTLDSFQIQEDSLHRRSVRFLVGIAPGGEGVLVNVKVRGIYQIVIKDVLEKDRTLFSRVDSELIFDTKAQKESDGDMAYEFNEDEEESLRTILANAHNRKVFEHLGAPHKT